MPVKAVGIWCWTDPTLSLVPCHQIGDVRDSVSLPVNPNSGRTCASQFRGQQDAYDNFKIHCLSRGQLESPMRTRNVPYSDTPSCSPREPEDAR